MPKRLSIFFAAALGLAALLPLPARAQTSGKGDPQQMLEEGTKTILRAFELFMKSIPQYEAPEVLPNGDIIIRRKNPPKGDEGDKAPPPPPGHDRT